MNISAVLKNIKNNGIISTYHLHQKREKKKKEAEKRAERARRVEKFKTLYSDNSEVGEITTTADFYFNEPIKKKTVIMVGLGKNVRGNLQYILNELNGNPIYEGYQIYVRTSKETDAIVTQYIQNNNWERTKTVLHDKPYNKLLETAQFLITEVFFPENWVKKDGQTYINIWHGTPIKKLGLAKDSDNVHKDGNTQKNFIDADYLLYPNEYTKINMLASYKVADLMKGEIINLGYPRTGGMLAAAQSNQSDLLGQLAPNGEKLYAYMPTWRDYLTEEQVVEDTKRFLDYMEDHLSDNQILYVNLHHNVNDSIDYSKYKRIRQFPPTIDNYLMLSMMDALISDYSSVFFDYLALRRQIILYCYDYEQYKKLRGTYIDLNELPFDKAYTPEQVLAELNRGKTYDDTDAYKQFCSHDSTDNAKKLCSIIQGDYGNLDLETIPKSGEKQVLIYTHTCETSRDTERLQEFVELKKDYKIYLSCEMTQVDQNQDIAYPMMHNVPVIGVKQNFYLSSVGRVALNMYQEGSISFENALEILQYDYELASKRWYGLADFDLLVIYDVAEPEMILALALMEVKKKLFFLSDSAFQRLNSGDIFLREVLEYVLPKMGMIYVDSQEKSALLRSICHIKVRVEKEADAKSLENIIHKYLNKFLVV